MSNRMTEANTPSPDEDRELKLDIRMSLEALAANEATVDETFNDITAVVLSYRAKLEEALETITKDGVGAAADWSLEECERYWAAQTIRCRSLARAALNRSTDRAT